MYRAFGLVIAERSTSLIGSDQSLHVASGRDVLPLRVRNAMPFPSTRQIKRPQRATVPALCTGDSYHPPASVFPANLKTLPSSPVAATNPLESARRRIAAPSFAWVNKVALRSRSSR